MSSDLYLAALFLPAASQKALQRMQLEYSAAEVLAALRNEIHSRPELTGRVEALKRDCNRSHIAWCTAADAEFPAELCSLPAMPSVLFYRGNIDLLSNKIHRVAIVGARNADAAGNELAQHFAAYLVTGGAVIVSGLALGIDAAAHRGSLKKEKCAAAIAVLAHGLDMLYPRTNQKLADTLLQQDGLLLSQFPPGVSPRPHQFLERNSVIAGIARCTLVVQAGQRSGALATARAALEFGRDVCAIPGSPSNPRHAGTNRIIQQGAHLVQQPADVAAFIPGFEEAIGETPLQQVSTLAQEILVVLGQREQAHISELMAAVSQPTHIHRELLQLQLDGLIQARSGNHYARCTGV